MNLIILAIVLISMLAISIAIKKSKKVEENTEKDFWEREHEANFTRKKSIDDLNYISIPNEIIDLNNKNINVFADKKIVNLNGIPNTDLKLEYGAPNITILSEYDQNYTDLITTLAAEADAYMGENKINEARIVLEYATDINTDIARCWEALANIYINSDEKNLIHLLIKKAENIKTFRGTAILRKLNEILDALP